MIYVKTNERGEVVCVSAVKMQGATAYGGTMPPRPIAEDDTEPRLMLKDGQLVWQVGKTEEEIAQMRQQAYEAECDQYQRAYLGYTLEGDTAKAESAKQAYLRAKAEVRKRLPYGDTVEGGE